MEYMENQMDDLITGANLRQEEINSFKLISMTDYVLKQEQNQIQTFADKYMICRFYALFLKQPLTLGMFVPCDEEGNILEEPTKEEFEKFKGLELGDFECNYTKVFDYQQAKERVLFEGFYKEFNAVISPSGGYLDTGNLRHKTIETIAGIGLELTQSALKQIGL